MSPKSRISVLVPAWNEAIRIRSCLESLLAITWPDLEILVSAGGKDGSFAAAQAYASDRVTVIEQRPGQGKQAALRELFALAKGDLIYLTDADCVVPNETFHAVVEPIIIGEAEAVTGCFRPFDEDLDQPLVIYRWGIQRMRERTKGQWSEGIAGPNAAVSRHALNQVGNFDADVPSGTDYHLARRLRAAGFGIRFVDSAVQTEYPKSPLAFFNQQSRWLRNTFLLGIKFRDRAEMRASTQTIMMNSAIVLFPLTWPVTRRRGVLFWLALLAELVRRRARFASLASAEIGRPLPENFTVKLPFFCLLDAVAGTRPAIDIWRKRWRTRW